MFGCIPNYLGQITQMKFNDNRLHIRIPALLLSKAHETAKQRNQTLSRIVRAYLEAYTASQPSNTAE
jgi:hypothetical protein